MGEVYRARDTKLERDIALKVLPTAFTEDVDRVARFKREARLLAALNHPHIGTIYGFEDAGPVLALVLELVDGETLDDRLTQGPLPLAEALTIAEQIADALDAAHGAGIVHRDLKPSNIKITSDGLVKVLDFGLAKAAGEGSTPDLSKSPTMTAGTSAGVILGTAPYMSPEQARGKAVDKRTDIWAFGCVLYQMLTGRRAFCGETVSDTIAAILEREPDWTAMPAGTPPVVRRLLQRCLEKDARRRLRDIGDVRHWLEEAPSRDAGAGATDVSRQRSIAWLLGGVALVLTIVGAGQCGPRRLMRPHATCNSNDSPISSGLKSHRPFRRTASPSHSSRVLAADVRSGSGSLPEAHLCKSLETTPTTSSRGGRRIQAPSSTLCRR